MPLEDEFHVVPAMIAELSDMGFEIVARPFAEPTDSDLLVKVTPVGGWDMTQYLQKRTDSVYCGEVGPTRHLIILLLQGSLARGARRTA